MCILGTMNFLPVASPQPGLNSLFMMRPESLAFFTLKGANGFDKFQPFICILTQAIPVNLASIPVLLRGSEKEQHVIPLPL